MKTIALILLSVICSASHFAQVASPTTPAPESNPEQGNLSLQTFEAAWRIINDTYFDPSFHGIDWAAVRTELRPRAASANSPAELRSILEEMLDRLGASHMGIIPRSLAHSIESGRPGGADRDGEARPTGDGESGLDIRIVGSQALITRVEPESPAAAAGIKPGWIVRSVDETLLEPLLKELPWDERPSYARFLGWRLVAGHLTGRPGGTLQLELLNGQDRPVSCPIRLAPPQGTPAKLGHLPVFYSSFESRPIPLPGGGTVGLIRFNLWMIAITQPFDLAIERFRNAEGIIIDLRGNLGGLAGMILGLSGHFLKDRVSLGTLKMRESELHFYTNPRLVNPAGERVEPYAGPVAILIDDLTLSAGEIFAAGMQAVGRARLFGQTTGGQALPAIWDKLPNGDLLYHAFGDFVTASGARVEGRGVEPDEAVLLKRADLLAGRDAALASAIRWIQESRKRTKGN